MQLRQYFPDFRVRIKQSLLVATGDLSPTPLSRNYRIRLTYKLFSTPKVHILSPDLTQMVGDRKLPHVYKDGSLCLFLPCSGEWTPSKFLGKTILPWTSEWLYFFELWLAVGEWHGGGLHPDPEGYISRWQRRHSDKKRKRKSGLQDFIY